MLRTRAVPDSATEVKIWIFKTCSPTYIKSFIVDRFPFDITSVLCFSTNKFIAIYSEIQRKKDETYFLFLYPNNLIFYTKTKILYKKQQQQHKNLIETILKPPLFTFLQWIYNLKFFVFVDKTFYERRKISCRFV